jgi:hypothetical protein
MKSLSLAALVASAALVSACHSCPPSEARFWEVRDAVSGVTAYTVDTAKVGFETIDTKFVDRNGALVVVDRPASKHEMSESDWVAATHGASWALHWCVRRQACWAAVRER